MNASTALVERFLALCSFDVRLRSAIAAIQVTPHPDGLIAFIREAPQQDPRLWHFMGAITQSLHRLGHFKTVWVQTEQKALRLEMTDLLTTFPAASNTDMPLPDDRPQPDPHFEALANYKTRDYHVFVISIDGLYKDVRLQRRSTATIKPAAMLGNPIAAFIGAAGADYLMQELLAAYAQGEERDITYPVVHPNGEARYYSGTLIPIAGSQACILLSRRVKVPIERRSLSASE